MEEFYLLNYVKSNYDLLDDLCKRLQDDYNGDKPFQQTEEDRLIIYDLLDLVEKND